MRSALPPISIRFFRGSCASFPLNFMLRNSAVADKPRDAFRGQSRSPNMVPFHILGMISYYRATVTLSLRRTAPILIYFVALRCLVSFLRYLMSKNIATLNSQSRADQGLRLQKRRDLQNRVSVSSRSLKISPCDREHMTSYWCSIVTMALSRVVSEIFSVEKYCDLEIRVKSQSRSLDVVPFDWLGIVHVLLVFCSNFVLKTPFLRYSTSKSHNLENLVRVRQGHWKCHHSNTAHTTSY